MGACLALGAICQQNRYFQHLCVYEVALTLILLPCVLYCFTPLLVRLSPPLGPHLTK